MAFATSALSGRTMGQPANVSPGISGAPPPTRITGTMAPPGFIKSTAAASFSTINESTASHTSAATGLGRDASEIASRPCDTATSVRVITDPPKHSAF